MVYNTLHNTFNYISVLNISIRPRILVVLSNLHACTVALNHTHLIKYPLLYDIILFPCFDNPFTKQYTTDITPRYISCTICNRKVYYIYV